MREEESKRAGGGGVGGWGGGNRGGKRRKKVRRRTLSLLKHRCGLEPLPDFTIEIHNIEASSVSFVFFGANEAGI